MHAAFGAPVAMPAAEHAPSDKADVGAAGFFQLGDVDAADIDVPEAVAEYVNDIYSHFKDTEVSCRQPAPRTGRQREGETCPLWARD